MNRFPSTKSIFRVAKAIGVLAASCAIGVSGGKLVGQLTIRVDGERRINQQIEWGDDSTVYIQETHQLLQKMQDAESATRHLPEFEAKIASFSELCERSLNLPDITARQEQILHQHGRTDAILRKQEACFQRNRAAMNAFCETIGDLVNNHRDDQVFDEIIAQLHELSAAMQATGNQL